MWMRRTSKSKGNGAISIGLLMPMAIWLIRGSVKSGIEMRPSGSSSKLLLSLVTLRNGSQQMGMPPIHEQYGKYWAKMCSIGPRNTSIIDESKITVASNSGSIPCAALEPLKLRHAFVVTRDELRNSLRPRRTMGEVVSLLEQRQVFLQCLASLQTAIQAAS